MPRSQPRKLTSPDPDRWRPFYPWLLLLVVGVAYANSFEGTFLFDDVPAILNNPKLRDLSQPSHWVTAPPDTTMAGRPFGAFTIALTVWLGGLTTWPFHLGNLCIHATNTLLVFGIGCRIYQTVKAPLAGGPFRAAFCAALLWALHPVHTNAVTYIIQRAESLMAFGVLLSVYSFLRANQTSPRQAGVWLVVSVVASYAAMLCKETAVISPLAVLLLDLALFQPSFRRALSTRPRFYLILTGSWILLAVLVAQGHRTQSVGFSFSEFPWWRYLLEQGPIILAYLKLVPYPSPLIFAAYVRDDTPIWALLPAALAVALLGIGSLYLFCKRPALGLAPVLFFLILAPTSSVLPIVTEPYAEHRLYLASLPLIMLAVWASARWVAEIRFDGRPLFVAALGLALVFAWLTHQRNRFFADPVKLWADVAQKQPFNSKAWNNLGEALAVRDDLESAGEAFLAALKAQRDNHIAAFNLGVLRARQGRHEEAIAAYQQALQIKPDYPAAFASAAHSLIQLGRFSEAAYVLAQALTLDPFHPIALLNLAVVQSAQGQPEAARRTAQKLLRHHPDDSRARALARSLGINGESRTSP